MADVSRVEYNDEPLIDLTNDTVTPASLRSGVTAHNAAGDLITGVGGGITTIDDEAGRGDWDKVWSADKTWRSIDDVRKLATGRIHNEGVWSDANSYDKYVTVTANGNSYMALDDVPVGVDIHNNDYWLKLAEAGGAVNIDDNASSGDTTVTWSADKISKTAICFDTVSTMKSSNLKVGEIARTFGYYSISDGGGALYKIVNTIPTNIHYESLSNGLYARLLVFDNFVDASQCGVIGLNATEENINSAKSTAVELGANLRFSNSFTTPVSIIFGVSFRYKTIEFLGEVIYNGEDAAIILQNSSYIIVKGTYIKAENGIGIELLQSGSSQNECSNVSFDRIKAEIGVYFRAENWGILNGYFRVSKIFAEIIGIKLEAIEQESGAEHPSYIGNYKFDVEHIIAGDKTEHTGWAVYMIGPVKNNAIVTGIIFDSVSFENSGNGIKMEGDVKGVEIKYLRNHEYDSFGKIIQISGPARYIYIHGESPFFYRQIDVAITDSPSIPIKKGVRIDGGIMSPSGNVFADELLFSQSGVTINSSNHMRTSSLSGEITMFDDDNDSKCWLTYNVIECGGTLTLRNLYSWKNYSNNNVLYVSQNYSQDKYIKIYEGDTLLFDGEQYTESGRITYKLTRLGNASTVMVEKINRLDLID